MNVQEYPTDINREAIYREVWTEPMTKVAARYGLSDKGLAKICRKLSVPIPGRGFWQRLRAGQSVKPRPLPSSKGAQSVRLASSFNRHSDAGNMAKPKPPEIEQLLAFEALPENYVQVSEKLKRPHELTKATLEALRRGKSLDKNGNVSTYQSGTLDISVSPKQVNRALRILDALVKAFEARGFKVHGRRSYNQSACVSILGEEMEFRIFERLKVNIRDPKPSESRLLPTLKNYPGKVRELVHTGCLALLNSRLSVFSYHYRWVDRPQKPLEDQLNDFLIALYVKVAQIIVQKEAAAEMKKAEEEVRRKLREAEEAAQREIARRNELMDEANQWQTVQNLRRYIAELEAQFVKREGSVEPDSDLAAFLSWAKHLVDAIDPLPRRLQRLAQNPRKV